MPGIMLETIAPPGACPSVISMVDGALASLQCDVLRAIASGMPFAAVADLLCRRVEAVALTTACSVLLVDSEARMRPLAGPSLPAAYALAVDGTAAGPMVGSCGTAAYYGIPVEVRDIETDPRWTPYKTLPVQAGFRACWSSPIKAGDGRVVATFAFYYRSNRGPTLRERQIVEACVDLCALAIEREEGQSRLAETSRNLRVALQSMSQGLCLFDARDRLVFTNARFHEIYGQEAAVLKPGMHLREMIAVVVAGSEYPDRSSEEIWQSRKAFIDRRQPGILLQDMGGGRVVAISHQPLEDGGSVATYEDVTERQQDQRRMTYLAQHDALTGLPNRVLFQERLDAALLHCDATAVCAVLYLDLDHFKAINDAMGHATGDGLLVAVASRLRDCVRDQDVVARLGGDEFSILLTGLRQPGEAAELARRAVELLCQPYLLDGRTVVCGISVGIAVCHQPGGSWSEMLRRADLALYRAKAEGRGTHRYYEPEMDEPLRHRQQLEHDLRRALADGELELQYQPLVALGSFRISGFEALLRWHHPVRGLVLPGDFIALAEETGLIGPLGDWVLRQACRDASEWPADIRVAINLSPSQLQSDALVGQVQEALRQAKLAPGRLEFEITESVLLSKSPMAYETLQRLRLMGLRIALDDFGTGYSSLSYLRSFPIDSIKIDRSFISGMAETGVPGGTERGNALAIVRAIANLGHDLGMATVAEGIETLAQLRQARAYGCTEVQGYLLGAPRPASSLPGVMRDFAADAQRLYGDPARNGAC